MLQRIIDHTAITARIVRTEDMYKIVLMYIPLKSADDPITYECPHLRPYVSEEEARKTAQIILLGLVGLDTQGQPVPSVY